MPPNTPSVLLSSAPCSSSPPSPDASPVFFYGAKSGRYEVFSQHYSCNFTAPTPSFPRPSSPEVPSSSSSSALDTASFNSTEQYMMYAKALLFHDPSSAAAILSSASPKEQKALGRKVAGFSDQVWAAHRERIVEEGNYWKFTTCRDGQLKHLLLETGEREIVEASPRDRIWGIGYGANKAKENRKRWGMNLLGKALMRVRQRLRDEETDNPKVVEE